MGGKYARFNNELMGSDFHPKFVNTNELTIDSTIIQQRHWMAVSQTRMDSLKMARTNLSHCFLTYYQDNIQRQFGYPMLLKCCWPSQGENQEELLRKTEEQLNALQWLRSEVPLMCRNGFSINIGYYTSTLTDIKSNRLLTDPDVFLLRLHQEGKVQLTDEEMQKVKNFAEIEKEVRTHSNTDVSLYNVFQSDIIPILGKPLIAQYWDWDISEKYVPLEISILNSLDLDDTTCEILKAQTIMRDIDGKSHVASPRILELAHQEVHHPRLIQAIDNANQRIMDFLAENEHQEVVAPKAGSPASLRVPEEELKDITDGKALFESITAPFRGYVIYVDVWGTWCGPCRGQMEYVPALKKMLEGKPVVYLYFCNNSPDEAWRIYIRQNHLDTDNAIHYNLPKTQESAIEQYLEVSGFPTYRLVDTTGRLVPGGAPWPSNPSAVVAAIEQLLNK
jgi:thiol-disulfide isomerase/thioredoxin